MDKQDFIKWVSKLQDGYEPSEETRAVLAQIDLIAIVGPTGAGKSTIIDKLDIPYVMSDVSRAERPDEKEDRNYHFRTDYLDILKEVKEGRYAQFLVSQFGEFYGTRLSSYPKEGACTMAIIAKAIPTFQKLGFRSVKAIYVMPPSYVEWMRRVGVTRSGELLDRITEARQSLSLALEQSDQYQFVLNDDLETALSEVKALISGKETDQHRAELAKATAEVILERLGEEESAQ